MTRRFKHWAYLNEEGMELFGDVFPDKIVPVVSILHRRGPLGAPDNIEDYFVVQWDELTDEQKDGILETLGKKFKVTKGQIKGQIAEMGMPLRKSLTYGSGSNHPGFFFGGGPL